jgi:hypothetical protein
MMNQPTRDITEKRNRAADGRRQRADKAGRSHFRPIVARDACSPRHFAQFTIKEMKNCFSESP